MPDRIAALDDHECLIGTGAVWNFSESGKEISYRPRGRWRCNNGTAVMEAAIEGICQLPDFYVRAPLQDGRLVPVLDAFRPEDEAI